MTSHALAHQESVRTALEMSIVRRPNPDSDGLSEQDALWPQRLRRIVRARLAYWGRPDLIDKAELLLTELATNALRHGKGHKVGVRVFFRAGRCVIEVDDGSSTRPELRHAGLDDEGGRGLLLVESLAEEWGVSDDGTTTWCTLPLTEGPEEMQPAAATTPVFREIRLELPADPSASGLARIQARTMLAMAAWPGNQRHAIDVLHTLVENAVQHALAPGKADQPFGACLRFTETDELLIDVTDPVPHFPDFDQAVAGESGGGLWEIAQEGVELSWFVASSEFDAKTVRAVVRPGPVDL